MDRLIEDIIEGFDLGVDEPLWFGQYVHVVAAYEHLLLCITRNCGIFVKTPHETIVYAADLCGHSWSPVADDLISRLINGTPPASWKEFQRLADVLVQIRLMDKN